MRWYEPCNGRVQPAVELADAGASGGGGGAMESFGELLAVDERRTLEFFVTGLQDVSERKLDRQELLYNASVLAHYAQISVRAEYELPAPEDLSVIFDQFVVNTALPDDSHLMESAGAQCLLLTGFFEDQMRARYNIRWYAEIGANFFTRAATYEESRHKARLLTMIARHFEAWRQRHARLSRELREQPYLLSPSPRSLM